LACEDSCGKLEVGYTEEYSVTEASKRNAPKFFRVATPFVDLAFE
jgi:hypothetical protein